MESIEIRDGQSARAYGSALMQSGHVRLVPSTEEHFATLAQWWQRPDWAVLQQDVVKPRPHAAIVEQFRQWSSNASTSSVGFSVMVGDTLVGHVTMWGIGPVTRTGTFAIIIGPEHVGLGYGSAATRLMLAYGFEELGLHKVELTVWAYNDSALRAYERCGFVREGVRREAVFHAGAYHDQVLMGILEREYWAAKN